MGVRAYANWASTSMCSQDGGYTFPRERSLCVTLPMQDSPSTHAPRHTTRFLACGGKPASILIAATVARVRCFDLHTAASGVADAMRQDKVRGAGRYALAEGDHRCPRAA